jgi:hypothetical protein
MVNVVQIYAIIRKKQARNAKTLDFVNNSAFLLITQALQAFIYREYKTLRWLIYIIQKGILQQFCGNF